MIAGQAATKSRTSVDRSRTQLAKAKEALAAGTRVLVHSVDNATIDAEFIDAAKRNGTIVIPTLTVREGYSDAALGRSPALRYPLECVDPITRAKLERVIPEAMRTRIVATARSGVWERQRATSEANLMKLRAAGIPIAMGTDAGNPGTAHGPSVYREMEAMQAAGMPAREVLLSATLIAARAMGRDRDLGSIDRGKLADLVVFDADPGSDIANAQGSHGDARRNAVRSRSASRALTGAGSETSPGVAI